jgi:hypothetical protein
LIAVGLLSAAFAAPAGETLAPEEALPLHDARDAYTPAAAFLKDSFLVVWQSGRLAPGDLREGYKFCGDIVGCRVDKSGKALDAAPFVICKADDLQERPRLAAGKEVTLAVWHDLRSGKDWDVYAARISPDGKVLDPDGFLVSGGAHNQANPRVAWDGSAFVVVWQDFRGGKLYEVFAARVSADGKVLDAQGIALSKQGVSCYDPTVASSGDGRSFIYWCVDNVIGGRADAMSEGLLLTEGKPGAPTHKQGGREENAKASAGWGNTPVFAGAGPSAYMVAWRNEHSVGRGNGDPGANAYIFDARGKRQTPLTLRGANHRVMNADIAWDGSAFVAAWTEYVSAWGVWDGVKGNSLPVEAAFVSRIAEDGKLLGAVLEVAGKPAAPPAANVCAASDGAGATLIAYEKHPEEADVPIKIGFRMLTTK